MKSVNYTRSSTTKNIVVSEDLNQKQTLYAAKLAKWFVEANFICATMNIGAAHDVVCLKISDFILEKPGRLGDIIEFESQIVKLGKTSFLMYTTISNGLTNEKLGEGIIKFVTIDKQYHSMPHQLSLSPTDQENIIELRKKFQVMD